MVNHWVNKELKVDFEIDRFSLALANFTDEEGYGRFLDLHQCYEVYLNVKGLEVNSFRKFFFQ